MTEPGASRHRYEPSDHLFDMAMWLCVLFPLALIVFLAVVLA